MSDLPDRGSLVWLELKFRRPPLPRLANHFDASTFTTRIALRQNSRAALRQRSAGELNPPPRITKRFAPFSTLAEPSFGASL